MRAVAHGVAALLVGLLAAAGCRTPVPGPAQLAPDDPRPARLLAGLRAAADERHALRGRATLAVDLAGGAGRLRGRQLIALERPARLRVEVKALFDQTVAVLVTDAGEFELLRADDHSYRRGEAAAELLRETVWIDLAPREVVELLLAAPRLEREVEIVGARAEADGAIELDLAGGDGALRHRVGFLPGGRLGSLERIGTAGGPAWRVDYDQYADVSGTALPHRLRLVTASRAEAELRLSDLELNPELAPELFRLRR